MALTITDVFCTSLPTALEQQQCVDRQTEIGSCVAENLPTLGEYESYRGIRLDAPLFGLASACFDRIIRQGNIENYKSQVFVNRALEDAALTGSWELVIEIAVRSKDPQVIMRVAQDLAKMPGTNEREFLYGNFAKQLREANMVELSKDVLKVKRTYDGDLGLFRIDHEGKPTGSVVSGLASDDPSCAAVDASRITDPELKVRAFIWMYRQTNNHEYASSALEASKSLSPSRLAELGSELHDMILIYEAIERVRLENQSLGILNNRICDKQILREMVKAGFIEEALEFAQYIPGSADPYDSRMLPRTPRPPKESAYLLAYAGSLISDIPSTKVDWKEIHKRFELKSFDDLFLRSINLATSASSDSAALFEIKKEVVRLAVLAKRFDVAFTIAQGAGMPKEEQDEIYAAGLLRIIQQKKPDEIKVALEAAKRIQEGLHKDLQKKQLPNKVEGCHRYYFNPHDGPPTLKFAIRQAEIALKKDWSAPEQDATQISIRETMRSILATMSETPGAPATADAFIQMTFSHRFAFEDRMNIWKLQEEVVYLLIETKNLERAKEVAIRILEEDYRSRALVAVVRETVRTGALSQAIELIETESVRFEDRATRADFLSRATSELKQG